VGRPQPLLQFFSGDHPAGLFHQHGENLKRLSLKGRLVSISAELCAFAVQEEFTEANQGLGFSGKGHRYAPNVVAESLPPVVNALALKEKPVPTPNKISSLRYGREM